MLIYKKSKSNCDTKIVNQTKTTSPNTSPESCHKALCFTIFYRRFLTQFDIKINNVFSNAWQQQLGFKSLLYRCVFKKRPGAQASILVYLLMHWVWLKVDSVAMFSRDALLSFHRPKKMRFTIYLTERILIGKMSASSC